MRFYVTVFLILLSLTISNAENYIVNSADEIKQISTAAQPGDTLFMSSGLWIDQQITFSGNGTESSPIVLMPKEEGKVILSGFSNLRISGNYLEVNGLRFVGGYSRSGGVIEFRGSSSSLAHNCRLTNTSIVDYNPSAQSNNYKWVSLYGQYNRVDHCYFKGKNHSGTTLVVWLAAQPNYHLIDHNYFAHRPELGYNGGETIRVGTSEWSMYDSFTTVEYNYFEQCDGEIEIISSKSGENIYRYNTFYDCEGMLTLRHGNRNQVHGNFFMGNKNSRSGGVRIIGEDHKVYNNYFYELYGSGYRSALTIMNGVPDSPLNRYFQVKNALVAFNTFIDCKNTFTIGAGSNEELSLPPRDCVIANNAVITDDEVIEFDDQPINMQWVGNLIQSPDLGIDPTNGISLVDMLYDPTDYLWRPLETSPVIGAGVGDYSFITDDIDGQARLDQFDVGADQVSADPITNRPLTGSDVGPAWLNSTTAYLLLTTRAKGEGSIILDPPGGLYALGESITIQAIPDSGWRFVGWQGSIEDTLNPITVLMDENKTLEAVFEIDAPPQYVLSTYVFSSGGYINSFPSKESYAVGDTVLITAIPDSGWEFVEWGGALSGNENPATIIMNADKSLFATFRPAQTFVERRQSPFTYYLGQNYPNPFNPQTTIPFGLAKRTHVEINVYNTLGQHIALLTDKIYEAGEHSIVWDGRNETGLAVQSGVYVYVFKTGDFADTHKLTILK